MPLPDKFGGALNVYEVHPLSWRLKDGRPLSYLELIDELVPYVKYMQYTHVELMGILEHPYPPSWGYQVIGFYAPTSRLGSPTDFKRLIDAFHKEGIGVLLDVVLVHFPGDATGLAVTTTTTTSSSAPSRIASTRRGAPIISTSCATR